MGRSEELGTGIRNVYKYSKAYSGSDKIMFSEEDIFVSKVPLKNLVLENGGLNGGLNDGQKRVFQLIQENEGIKVKEISNRLNIPIDTIDKQIKVLINKNLIEHRGSRKTGGYYKIKEKEPQASE